MYVESMARTEIFAEQNVKCSAKFPTARNARYRFYTQSFPQTTPHTNMYLPFIGETQLILYYDWYDKPGFGYVFSFIIFLSGSVHIIKKILWIL